MTIEQIHELNYADEWRYLVKISGREIATYTEHSLRVLPELIADRLAKDFITHNAAAIIDKIDLTTVVNLVMAKVAVAVSDAAVKR